MNIHDVKKHGVDVRNPQNFDTKHFTIHSSCLNNQLSAVNLFRSLTYTEL